MTTSNSNTKNDKAFPHYFHGLRPHGDLDWVTKYNETVMDATTRRHFRDRLQGWLKEFDEVVATVQEAYREEYAATWAQDVQDIRAALEDMDRVEGKTT